MHHCEAKKKKASEHKYFQEQEYFVYHEKYYVDHELCNFLPKNSENMLAVK